MQFKEPLPIAIPNIGKLEEKAVLAAIRLGWVSTVGPQVNEFENGLALEAKADAACAVAAGTMGLHLALHTLDVKHNDLVICPAYTFIATANATSQAGAKPYFVDIEAKTWTLCPEKLSFTLDNDFTKDNFHKTTGQKLAAIMPVYTFGCPADMDKINAIAKARHLPVIADAAAAIGATYKNQAIGQLADLTVYSFNGNKTITTGGGGAVLGNEALIKRVKHLASTARVGANYDHDEAGFNYRITNLEAALGVAQLSRLQEFIAKKRTIRDFYAENLNFKPFPEPEYARSALWFSGVILPCDKDIYEVCENLNRQNIMARPFWKPMQMQKPYADCLHGNLDNTNALWQRVLVLPCSTHLKITDLKRIVKTVKSCV